MRVMAKEPAADTGEPRVVQMPALYMRADIVPKTIDDEQRTVEAVFSTGAPVRRTDWYTGRPYIEKLSMDPAHVRIDRLNAGAPLLDSHAAFSVSDVLGSVVPGSVTLTKGAMMGRVRFSKRDAVQPIWEDVRDGHLRSLSIGYRVNKYAEEPGKTEGAPPIRTAVDWEVFEVSMVSVPADANAKLRGAEAPENSNPCEIVTRSGAGPAVPAQETTTPPAAPAKETKMDEKRSETIVERDQLAPAAAAAGGPEPSEKTERAQGAEAERARVAHIRLACEAGRMTRAFEADLIDKGVSENEASRRIFEELKAREINVPREGDRRPDVRVVGDDPLIHVRAGIENALLHRIASDRHKLEDVGRAYRGMSILDIGKAFLTARGVRVSDMSRSAVIDAMLSRSGMHSTSDFVSLLSDVAHKNLRSAYDAAPQTWLPLAQPISLTDFKASNQLQVGDAPALDEVLEHGEFTLGSIGEAKEQVQLKTYGRIFAITRQALINDDLNAFGQVPAAFGRKARDKESDLAWAQITGNPAMGDGYNLFDATNHGNYTSSGTAISVDSLGVGRKAIRVQKGIDGVTPLNLSPQYLIVPATKETIGEQYVAQNIVPTQNSAANPFGPNGRTPLTLLVEPRLDASSTTAWYLATAVVQAPVLYYATLDGQSGPDLRPVEGFDVDGIKFRCRIDVGFKAADWRAIYKNAGA